MPEWQKSPRGLASHYEVPDGVSAQEFKTEFGRRLRRHIRKAGLNDSEFARQASEFMPEGKKIGRDNISSYVLGKQLPGEVPLKAICDALKIDKLDLVGIEATAEPSRAPTLWEVRDVGKGRAEIKLHLTLPTESAMRIVAIVNEVNGSSTENV